jgi:hypothetical protein
MPHGLMSAIRDSPDRGVTGPERGLDSVHDLEREADLEYFDRVELEFCV